MKNKIIITGLLAVLTIIGVSLYDAPQLGNTRAPIETPVEKPVEIDRTLALVAQMEGKSRAEKKQIQAEVISRDVRPDTYTVGDLEIHILSVSHFDGGVEVMARAWRNGKQLGFGKDGSVDIERFRFYGIETFVEDPDGKLEQQLTRYNALTDRTEVVRTAKFKTDPQKALVEALVDTINLAHRSGKIEQGKVGRTTSTFYPAAGANSPVDGFVVHSYNPTRTGVSMATIMAAAGSSHNNTATYLNFNWYEGSNAGGFWYNLFSIMLFNTAAIDTDSIVSATVSLYVESDPGYSDPSSNNSLVNIATSSPASNSTLANSDYQTLGRTKLSTGIAMNTMNADKLKYHNWALNSTGIAAINKTGITKLAMAAEEQITRSEPNWGALNRVTQFSFSSADQTGTSQDPKLVIVHEAGAAAPTGEEYIMIFQ